ncbi:mannonate dehydratase [Oceaniglobus trochenteri]|uniref:mannonate dehydratase n=1 Tax=Oceaniglobus trochenteri TaxID=2763260 RepID=UPI001CFF8648|nr:mannonate dehydratase [Oceaniglobus trochenteri]
MIESWRWFGPSDPVTLADARQAGARGIVTALHEQYDGRAWSPADIAERAETIRHAGFDWTVCESIPMHSSIKLRTGEWRKYIDQWKLSLDAVGRAGVPVVCYNFMPVVDWTRTDLRHPTRTGGLALRFDMASFVAYDVFVLERDGSAEAYSPEILAAARKVFDGLDDDSTARLERTIIAGLPGGEDSYTRETIRARLAEFSQISDDDLRGNLIEFLREVVPVAEEAGTRLAVHPDDPPFSLFGLPRVVSTPADLRAIMGAVDSDANGLTLCVGSLSTRPDNDVPAIAREFADRIHFAHLRNVTCDADGSFMESEHLDGRTDMVDTIAALLHEEERRCETGHVLSEIAMRPDHGHLLIDDIHKTVNPGYSCIGRLKGLAELRGVIAGLTYTRATKAAVA